MEVCKFWINEMFSTFACIRFSRSTLKAKMAARMRRVTGSITCIIIIVVLFVAIILIIITFTIIIVIVLIITIAIIIVIIIIFDIITTITFK